MRYSEFRDVICQELQRNPNGFTWRELKLRLELPYKNPCPEWITRIEREKGLTREPGPGRAFVWRLGPRPSNDSQD